MRSGRASSALTIPTSGRARAPAGRSDTRVSEKRPARRASRETDSARREVGPLVRLQHEHLGALSLRDEDRAVRDSGAEGPRVWPEYVDRHIHRRGGARKIEREE